MSSLRGIVLLEFLLERGMFCEQFRCSIIIDGKTFEGVLDVRKVKGSEYMNLYSIQGEFPVLYTNVKIMGKKFSKTFCTHGTFHPPRGDVWG